jgi:hypothetical protein
MSLQPAIATIVNFDEKTQEVSDEEDVDINVVQAGDVLKVVKGSKVPVDGIVVRIFFHLFFFLYSNRLTAVGERFYLHRRIFGHRRKYSCCQECWQYGYRFNHQYGWCFLFPSDWRWCVFLSALLILRLFTR